MGGYGLMGLVGSLLGNWQGARRKEQMAEDASVHRMGQIMAMVADPDSPVQYPMELKAEAHNYLIDSLGQHSPKEDKQLVEQMNDVLKKAIPIRYAQRQQLQQQAQAQGTTPTPWRGADAGGTRDMTGLQTLAALAPTAVQEGPPTRRAMVTAPDGSTQYVPVPVGTNLPPGAAQRIGAAQAQFGGAPVAPTAGTPQFGGLQAASGAPGAQPHRGPLMSVLSGLKDVGTGIEQAFTGMPRNVTRGWPGADPSILAPSAQMTQQQQIAQRMKEGKDLGMSGDALIVYGITGKPPAGFGAEKTGVTGEEQDIAAAIQAGMQKAAAEGRVYTPADRKRDIEAAHEAWGKKQAAAKETGDVAQLDQARARIEQAKAVRDNPESTPEAKAAAQTTIQDMLGVIAKKRGDDMGFDAPPGYKKGDPSIANPNGAPYVDLNAVHYLVTDKLPTGMGMGQAGALERKRVQQRAGEMMVNWGMDDNDIEALRTMRDADVRSFRKINDMDVAVGQLEATLENNMQIAETLNKAYARSDFPFINEVLSSIITGTGGTEAQNLGAQLHGVALEWAKIMEGSTMSARGVNVSSAADAEEIIRKDASSGQLVSLFNLIRRDARAREAGVGKEKNILLDRIRHPEQTFTISERGRGGSAEATGNLPQPPQGRLMTKTEMNAAVRAYVKAYGEKEAPGKMREAGFQIGN